jgi:hypothetical protein
VKGLIHDARQAIQTTVETHIQIPPLEDRARSYETAPLISQPVVAENIGHFRLGLHNESLEADRLRLAMIRR